MAQTLEKVAQILDSIFSMFDKSRLESVRVTRGIRCYVISFRRPALNNNDLWKLNKMAEEFNVKIELLSEPENHQIVIYITVTEE